MSHKIYCQSLDRIGKVQEYHYQFFDFLFGDIDLKRFLKKSKTSCIVFFGTPYTWTKKLKIVRNQIELTTCEFDMVSARQIATFFDPRYKNLFFESKAARDANRSHVLGHFTDEKMDKDGNEIQETAMDFLFQTAPKQTSGESQFRMYLSERQLGHNMNPFEWWALRESRYPAVAKLAKKFVCIPASSASSERVFFTAGNIISAKRSCLLSENVNLARFTLNQPHSDPHYF